MPVEVPTRHINQMDDRLPGTSEETNETSNLRYIINHVFLLPKLPQKDDSGPDKDSSLLVACEEAIDSFKSHFYNEELRKLLVCKKMMRDMLKLRSPSGDLVPEEIERILEAMNDGGNFQ